MNIKPLIEKTIYHLRTNGITPTVKKVLRRLSGTNWLPYKKITCMCSLPLPSPTMSCGKCPQYASLTWDACPW